MTERRPGERIDRAIPDRGEPTGFRPTSRRRSRIAAGAMLAAVAIGGNVLLYASLDDTTAVLQLTDNIRAGEQITMADLRTVEVEVDPTVPTVAADDLALVVGQYATTYIAAGSLLFDGLVQARPLVTSDAGVVAVEVAPTRLPAGLLERSRVQVVIVRDDDLTVVEARVVAIGRNAEGGGSGSLSVEVAIGDAAAVAAAGDVRIVLVDPATDPVTEEGGG